MRNLWHRSLCMFLTALMIWCMIPLNTFAAEEAAPPDGRELKQSGNGYAVYQEADGSLTLEAKDGAVLESVLIELAGGNPARCIKNGKTTIQLSTSTAFGADGDQPVPFEAGDVMELQHYSSGWKAGLTYQTKAYHEVTVTTNLEGQGGISYQGVTYPNNSTSSFQVYTAGAEVSAVDIPGYEAKPASVTIDASCSIDVVYTPTDTGQTGSDSGYNNTITIETVAPEGLEAGFDVAYSVAGKEDQGTTYYKQDTEISVTLTPGGSIPEQVHSGVYSGSMAYIRSVTVKNADGNVVASRMTRGSAENLHNATVTFTTASNTAYTIVAEYGVLEMKARAGDVTLDMYQKGGDYEAEVPSAEEIFYAVIGDCSDDFLEKYENMTMEFYSGNTWETVTGEKLLALSDGTTIEVRVTWKQDDQKTYYPVAVTREVKLLDPRAATSITGTVPTKAVEFVEESQLVEKLKEAMGFQVMAGGAVLEGASIHVTVEETGSGEQGCFANVTVSYGGSTEYKPSSEVFGNVPIADIPDTATITMEIGNADVVITNSAGDEQTGVEGGYTLLGNTRYTFKLVPDSGYAVECVRVNGGEVPLTYSQQAAFFSMELDEKCSYQIVVQTVPAELELETERIYDFAPGVDIPTNEAIAEAVLTDSGKIDKSGVQVKYLARSAGTAQISIPEIVILEGVLTIPASTVDVELEELWLEPTALIEKVGPEEATGALAAELFEKVHSGELAPGEVDDYIERYIQGLPLNAHAFGTNGDGSTETIRVSYEDDKYLIPETTTDVTIRDNRTPTVLAAEDCEVAYGYSVSQLLAASGAVVTAEGAAVSGAMIGTDSLNLHASGAVLKVTLFFSGDEYYQPSEATINVTVNKAAASIDCDSQFIIQGSRYDFSANASPADMQILEFMIGLDTEPSQAVGDIRLRLPASIRQSVVGEYLQGEMTLGEVAALVERLGDRFGVNEESMTALGQIVKAISGVADPLEVKVILSAENFEPEDVGIYIAGAVTADTDFETAYTASYLIVSPASAACTLEWKHSGSNGTMPLPVSQEYDSEMLGAYTAGDGQISYLILETNDGGEFLTTDAYGNISANIYSNLENIRNDGHYVQIAYMQNYSAMPIARSFVTVPNNAVATVTVANAEKVYGEADPEFTYTADGLADGEELNVTLSREAGEAVGTYAITAEAEKNFNYNITVKPGTLTVTERAVTVRLDNCTVRTGDALPVWTYTVTSGNVVPGDTLKLAITCDAKDTQTAGSYTIMALDCDPNYAITVVGGTLTVQQKQDVVDEHEGCYPVAFDPDTDTTGTIFPGGTVEVDGIPYVLDGNCTAWVPDTDARVVTTYKYVMGDSRYQSYPTNMYVWFLTIEDSDGGADQYTAQRVEELDDFFKYEGTSIRVDFSSNGIRFFTSVPAGACRQLMDGDLLSGFRLLRAGTLYAKWRGEGSSLILGTGVCSDVYGGKAGDAFRVFSQVGGRNWYTGVLTGLDGDGGTLGMDILARPFAMLERDGEQIVLYGGTVQRSIYYVAAQNRNYWAAGTVYDNFIENIIAAVESAGGAA